MAAPVPSVGEVVDLALKILGAVATVAGTFLTLNARLEKQRAAKRKAAEAIEDDNSDEARKLRDELRADKSAAERVAAAAQRERDDWKRSYYTLRNVLVNVLSNCRGSVRVALALLRGNQPSPAQTELETLERDLAAVIVPPEPETKESPA